MDERAPEQRGYRYYLSDEEILKYMAWPIALRLTWLEGANLFLRAGLPEETRCIRDALRRGEI